MTNQITCHVVRAVFAQLPVVAKTCAAKALLYIFAVCVPLMVTGGQALALSSACTAINSELYDVFGRDIDNTYLRKDFADNETITYSTILNVTAGTGFSEGFVDGKTLYSLVNVTPLQSKEGTVDVSWFSSSIQFRNKRAPSGAFRLRVNCKALPAATITTQPADQTVSATGKAVFSIVAQNVKSYQWQMKRKGESDWSNLADFIGGNSSTLTLSNLGVDYHNDARLRVVISGSDGLANLTSREAILKVLAADATLSGLTLSEGSLSPSFAAGTTSYTVSVSNSVSSISITPTVNEANATVKVDGIDVASGTASAALNLDVGPNAISIAVTAQDGNAQTYTIVVTRLAAMPFFQSMTPEAGPLEGGTNVVIFGKNLGSATGVSFGGKAATSFNIESDERITAVTPSADAFGTVPVRVSFTGGGYVERTAGFRYGSSDALLSALTFSAGTIEPAFSPATTTYTLTVPHEADELSVTATTADAGAKLTIRDTDTASGSPFGPFPLEVGNNKLGIRILAEDRSTDAHYYITVHREAAPLEFTFTPAAGALTSGQVGADYAEVTVTATGGTAPYSFSVTSGALPKGLSLDPSSGVISGKPTVAGKASFTVSATDANDVTGKASYSLVVDPASVSLTFSPAPGPLPDAMAGEPYDQAISATGGTAPYTYRIASGTLPDGLSLASSGELKGTPAEGTQTDYSFTVEAKDANGTPGSIGYTLNIKERTVTIADQTVVVPPGGTPTDVLLDRGATGGPFGDAELVSVEPANAGKATITMGDYAAGGPVAPVGWYLKFTPDPAYSGMVRVTFRLSSSVGTSTGIVTYSLGYDPAEVAQEIDGLVRGFVQTRQSMISSAIKVPGLLERRSMAMGGEPITTRVSPSAEGITLGFSTSIAQLEASRNSADGVSDGYSSPFNIWIDGTLMAHNRDDNGGKWGSFAMINLGADYLFTEKTLFGLSFHFDRMTDPTDMDAELTGNGWLAGPYASFEIGKGVFWNSSVLYGGSSNDIDTQFWDGAFDTKRWMFDTSINGQWNLDDVTVLTPKLRAVYFSETVEDYAVKNRAGDEIGIDGFDMEQFRVSLGAEIARSFIMENDAVVTPKLGITGGFSGIDGSGAFGSVIAGVSLETASAWTFDASLLFNIEGDGETSVGASAGARTRF